jgi:dTDP-glucose 4,6-dehydratase
MTEKILITGGNGFIATNFIHYLYEKYPDTQIINIDCLDFPNTAANHDHLNKDRYQFVHGSILDKDLLAKLFKEHKFKQVVNFAAKSHVDNSIASPEIFVTTNILGTHNLLEQALKHETELFLHISTDEVYGSLSFEDTPTTEESNLLPNNPYSASKAGADCLVRSYIKTFKLPAIITRSSNNYGPYQATEKFIPVVITKALNNQKIPVYGQGVNRRDWIYVLDNCRGVDIARTKGKIGEIYNIPGDYDISNLELVKIILDSLAKGHDLINFVEDRKGHDLRYAMNGSKLFELGFKHEVDFKEGLAKTINWYIENVFKRKICA